MGMCKFDRQHQHTEKVKDQRCIIMNKKVKGRDKRHFEKSFQPIAIVKGASGVKNTKMGLLKTNDLF